MQKSRWYSSAEPLANGTITLIGGFQMQFMVDTSGLNSYAHAFMMPSGNTFIQANVSAMLWNPDTFAENRLPDMPNGVIRVYPASGGIAMLPLTPANNYNPTILFCGGSDMPEYEDCQRITPEPLDGSSPTSRWHYPRC
ncbi:hypothetical protein BJ322DRAFT_1098268 [Thelephora terrestris]|uniref:Glyoxal oxidase N-terminal domain-containing protein n=1 Tax=Thelephora terrestris TaxID=56493 RepID=A0A9P6HM35_9AGAM|nr:hypothetical protein BJ322DRAFT_1169302 [Thelephora terrestris]KAF9790495.1 hypothetical protein BJ322DRAFT_1098268 [Thelephora terrestris]